MRAPRGVVTLPIEQRARKTPHGVADVAVPEGGSRELASAGFQAIERRAQQQPAFPGAERIDRGGLALGRKSTKRGVDGLEELFLDSRDHLVAQGAFTRIG